MITFGPRYSYLLAAGRPSGPGQTDLNPANARQKDAGALQQLTAACRTRPKYAEGLDQPDSRDIHFSNDMPGWRYAFGLSKDAVKAATPPGTVKLVEHKRLPQDHDRPPPQQNPRDNAPSPEIDLAKFPVPTSDPSDPLNWARWRKLACLGTLCNYAFACSFASASLAPALAIWDESFPADPRGMGDLSRFAALNVLLLGLGNIVFVPLANVFGRRIVLVLSALTLFIATACGTRDFGPGDGKGYGMGMYEGVLVIRIFQGLGSSVSETVGPAVVGDMCFVQERGGWMALYTAFLASGSVMGGMSGGYIVTRYGWFGIFRVTAALTGIAFLAMVLLVPETLFERGPLCFPTIATASLKDKNRHRHRTRDIAEEEKGIEGGNDNDKRRSSIQRYYFQHTPTPYLSLDTLPSVRLTMPSRFVTRVYTPLNINTSQPQYFRDYWDPRLGLTWYETASESDESDDRFSVVHYGLGEPSMPTVLRPPPAAGQAGREATPGLPPPGTGGIAARRAAAPQGPRYRLYPPSEIDTRPVSRGGRGGNQNRPILPKPENNSNNANRLPKRFTLGPYRNSPFSIPPSPSPSTHYEPYTYLRSLRFFPQQQHPPPPNPFNDPAVNPFPESPYSPYSPNFPKPSISMNNPSTPRHPTLPFPTKKRSLWMHFVSPLLTLCLLPVWVATIQYSTLIGSFAVLSTLGPTLLASPPYNWTIDHSGLVLFSGALIGIILGGFYASILMNERMKFAGTIRRLSQLGAREGLGSRKGVGTTDRVKSWGERLFGGFGGNSDYGYAEAESRLMVALPGLIIATGGLLVWGFCGEYGPPLSAVAGAAGGNSTVAGNSTAPAGLGLTSGSENGGAGGGSVVNKFSWLGLVFGFGMVSFGVAGVPGVWFNYLIDSYANLASDCFVMICILRGLIPFAWTFFVSEWVAKQGYLVVFGGGLTVILGVFSLLLIPVIWYGKRMRIATARFVVRNQ